MRLYLKRAWSNGVRKSTEWSVKPKTLVGLLEMLMHSFAYSRSKSLALDLFWIAQCSKF